jgi:hypothetical protein
MKLCTQHHPKSIKTVIIRLCTDSKRTVLFDLGSHQYLTRVWRWARLAVPLLTDRKNSPDLYIWSWMLVCLSVCLFAKHSVPVMAKFTKFCVVLPYPRESTELRVPNYWGLPTRVPDVGTSKVVSGCTAMGTYSSTRVSKSTESVFLCVSRSVNLLKGLQQSTLISQFFNALYNEHTNALNQKWIYVSKNNFASPG